MPSTTPITYPVLICHDCRDAVEFSDDDRGYADGTLLAQQRRMKSHRPDLGLSMNPILATDDEPIDFSTEPCQTCGSWFAGARFGYQVIETQPDPDAKR